MSTIDRDLMKNENIVFRAKVSVMSQLGLILLGLFIIILTLTDKQASNYIVFVGLIPLFIALINIFSKELAFTNKRLIALPDGIEIVEFRFNKIETVSVDQGLLGLIFGYGTITCHGVGGYKVSVKNIKSPYTFRRRLNEYIEEHSKNND